MTCRTSTTYVLHLLAEKNKTRPTNRQATSHKLTAADHKIHILKYVIHPAFKNIIKDRIIYQWYGILEFNVPPNTV